MNADPIVQLRHDEYEISTDPSRLDFSAIHEFLTRVYWSEGISRELVERAARGALCFGIYHFSEQVGYARVITDAATFAYLSDVYVLEAHRGHGTGSFGPDRRRHCVGRRRAGIAGTLPIQRAAVQCMKAPSCAML